MCIFALIYLFFGLLYIYKTNFTVIYKVVIDKLSALIRDSADNLQMVFRYYMIEWCFSKCIITI